MQFHNTHKDLVQTINKWASDQQAFFLFVDFEMQTPELYRAEDLYKAGIQVIFPGFSNILQTEAIPVPRLQVMPTSYAAYCASFETVRRHLLAGNSFLVNLTIRTAVQSAADLPSIFQAANAPYRIKYKNQWVCFSPEPFVQIRDGRIRTYPMKGTLDAGLPDAASRLLSDAKETAEHYTIVDLLRNDLNQIAENVLVNRFRYLSTIQRPQGSLLQMSSEIEGELPISYKEQLGDLLFALLPAGSVSGAPKKKTLEIIREAEAGPRGFYTGTVFYFDGQQLDSCVLIRFIEQDANGALWYRSGGGITIHSDMASEYQECLEKIYVPGI